MPRRKGEVYRFGPPKNGKERTITPAPSVMAMLKEQKHIQNKHRIKIGPAWPSGEFSGLVFTDEAEPLMKLAETLLPPIGDLLGLIAPIIDLIAPGIAAIGTALGPVIDGLGKVVGWIVDGVSGVVDFFKGLFGGSKEASENMEALTTATEGLEEALDNGGEITIDTSSYAGDVENATSSATQATKEAAEESTAIADANFKKMAGESDLTYKNMAIGAEEAWRRMVAAADEGAAKIVAAFESIAGAASGVSNANISVSGVDMPNHAEGTSNFEGGWTHINERGGEVAFLPGGSAIIPADKSDRLMDGSSQSASYTFSPQVTVQGADEQAAEAFMSKMKTMFEEWVQQRENGELDRMAVQNGYT